MFLQVPAPPLYLHGRQQKHELEAVAVRLDVLTSYMVAHGTATAKTCYSSVMELAAAANTQLQLVQNA